MYRNNIHFIYQILNVGRITGANWRKLSTIRYKWHYVTNDAAKTGDTTRNLTLLLKVQFLVTPFFSFTPLVTCTATPSTSKPEEFEMIKKGLTIMGVFAQSQLNLNHSCHIFVRQHY